MKRLHQLDYLRGTIALCIMLYHFLLWYSGEHSAQSFLGRLGIYGVSVFYVLSGLTLFHVYHSRMVFAGTDIVGFWKKRVLRIFPIYWAVIFLTAIQRKSIPDIQDLLLNLTGLFGVFRWDRYLAVGAWSIGNELVFYLFFPLFILLSQRYKTLFWILGAVFLFVFLAIAFCVLQPDQTLASQWNVYIFPLNQVLLFYGGYALGYFFEAKLMRDKTNFILILVSVLLFLFIPSTPNTISLVTGWNRIFFTVIVWALCLAFYKMRYELPRFLHLPLIKLGEWSFGMYLLHPLVYHPIMRFLSPYTSRATALAVAIIVTIALSAIVYNYFETYFVNLGKKKNYETKTVTNF